MNRRVITYGTSAQADLRVTRISARPHGERISSDFGRRDLGCFTLHVPGAHNMLNAAAAVAVGWNWKFRLKRFARHWRISPAWTAAFRCAAGTRHHGDRRLRPPSHRDSRHACGGPRVPPQTHARAISAASLHAHAGAAGRFRPRLSSGRQRDRRWISTPLPKRPSKASPRRRWSRNSMPSGIATRNMRARSNAGIAAVITAAGQVTQSLRWARAASRKPLRRS